MHEELKKRLYDTAGDIIIKKGREFIDNPSGFNWNTLFAAVGGGVVGGIIGYTLKEKAMSNPESMGQLGYQIQQLHAELESIKRSGQTGNNNFQNQANNAGQNQYQAGKTTVLDEFGNIIK